MLAPNLFTGLIPNYKFDKFIALTTGEQIKLLIEKDIFIIYKDNEDLYYWKIDEETDNYTIKFNCPEDFNNFNFESLNYQKLNILGEYIINDNHIKLNDFIYEDFENSIKTSVHIELTFSDRLKDTDYELFTQPNNEAKLKYLHSKLDENDPLNLVIMNPQFNEIDNTLELNTPYLTTDVVDEEVLHSIIWNWITGSRGGEDVDFFNSPYLSLYRDEYKVFCIAQHYIAKINEINNGVNNESSPVTNLQDDNLNEEITIVDRYSYFFKKVNKAISKYNQSIELINPEKIVTLKDLDDFLSNIDAEDDIHVTNKRYWTNYKFAYFFIETNILKKMEANNTALAISKIICKAINRNDKNFREYSNEIGRISDKNITENRKKIHDKMSPLINYYKRLE